MKLATDKKLKAAATAYGAGYTCSQAVLCAYGEDLGLDRQTPCRMMEGFGGKMREGADWQKESKAET